MYQIDNATAAAVPPAPTEPGTPGFYTDGSAVGGVPATVVPAEHLNAMMMELVNAITAAGLTLDKANSAQLTDAIKALPPGRLIAVQILTSSTTYHASAGTKSVVVEAIGGAGGSVGTAATSSTQWAAASGAGGGTYVVGRYTAGFDGVAVTIGSGGAAGTGGAGGGAGGSTTFGSLLTAPGGAAGNAGIFSTSVSTAFVPGGGGGAVGSGSGIIYQLPGQAGLHGFLLQNSQLGGDGGGSGKGGSGGKANGNSSFTSNAGVAPGTGAGGITASVSQAAKSGAAGVAGLVVVWEYA